MKGFYLTRGAALASIDPIARGIGGRVEVMTDAPAFRRVVLAGSGGEGVRVDLVRDTSPRTGPPPNESQGLVLDSPEEILANNLCALLGRSEVRDLIDLFFLEKARYSVRGGMGPAMRKDGGLTPSALAWSLSQVPLERLPDGLLAPVALEDLRAFAERLRSDLVRMGLPGGTDSEAEET